MSYRSIPEYTKEALEILSRDFLDVLNQFEFYLAGGTALALQIDHRVSYDLDFFTQKSFDPQDLLKNFSSLELKNIETSFGTLKFQLNDCFVSFFYYEYPVLESFVDFENKIKLANLIDIGLMKITAIADRGVKKDFYDLYFISRKIGSLKEICKNFYRKFPDANFYHYLKALTFFEDADNSPYPDLIEKVDWDEIKKYFVNQVKSFT